MATTTAPGGPPPNPPSALRGEDDTATSPPPALRGEDGSGEREIPFVPTLAAAALATTAAAWVAGGVFRDPLGRGIGILGVLVAVGLAWAGRAIRRELLAQVLTLPVAALVGAFLVLPDARGGSATLPSLVVDAVRAGGLLQPPIPLDPGWRLILVVVAALVTSASLALALGTSRPRLAVALPGLVVVMAALVQPDNAELVSALGGIVGLAGGLAAAYGSELGGDAGVGREFELNRIVRGAGLAVALVVGMVLLSRAGVLFPQQQRSAVVPPVRPQAAPPVADRVLFSVKLDRNDIKPTYRLGVIDVYQAAGTSGGAWLLPPYDSRKLEGLTPPATLPGTPALRGSTFTATFTIANAEGHDLPTLAQAEHVAGARDSMQLNPRTDTLRLRDRPAYRGLRYTVTAALPPSGKDLATIGPTPGAYDQFLAAPPEPSEVVTLLAAAPPSPFARLQYVRQALYSKVVSAGEGKPVDVSPNRVAAMLDGAEASPYEITAAEALLARWAGVPSRIAFGYYGGDQQDDGSYAIHPLHGATWLETYFAGYGWVPIVGTPPKAKPSFSDTEKNPNPNVLPSQDLALVVYVPVRVTSAFAFYEVASWYLLVAAPFVLALLLLLVLYPWLLKVARRALRRRWAARHGLRGRIVVAYAEFRDTATDLAVGSPAATPLAFLRAIDADPEHTDLAWLVTRALWGDLQRGLRREDAEAAEELSASVARRLRAAQGTVTRVLALASRASLREPFTREVPNPWPAARERPARVGRRRRARPAMATMLLLAVGLTAWVASPRPAGDAPWAALAAAVKPSTPPLGALLPPDLGRLHLQREPKVESAFHQAGALVHDGEVYTIRHDGITEGSVQLSVFYPDVHPGNDVISQLAANIGTGNFQPMEVPQYIYDGHCFCAGAFHLARVSDLATHGHQKVYRLALPEQTIYLWFPRGGKVMALVAVRAQFTAAASDAFVLSLVDYEHGVQQAPIPVPSPAVGELPVPTPNAGLAP